MYKFFKALRFVLYPLYLISHFVPKNTHIWVFGAHQNRFAENSKVLFEYASNKNDKVKCIWITGNKALVQNLRLKGYEAYIRWSVQGVFYSLCAKYYFYNLYSDDINYYTSGNAVMVNLWHGIPLKKIEFDIYIGAQSKMFNSIFSPIYRFFKPYIFRNPNYVLSTSIEVSKLFTSAFRVSKQQCLELGYPRCDVLFKENNTEILRQLDYIKGDKIIVYMPTWRDQNKNFINEALPDLNQLNHVLEKNHSRMIIKLHPNTKSINDSYSNIIFIDSKIDIYALLPHSDLLITDYSSIYFDYLLLNKEIIFYPFDYDMYMQVDRDFYFDYEAITPGIKVDTFSNLLDSLDNMDKLQYKEERKKLKNKLWCFQDGHASARVYSYFENKINSSSTFLEK
jgi:CDP-glycerol glycerophosphotransferase (TagB/SpsB family)